MTDEYRVAKHQIAAEITLVGQPPVRLKLFLGERARAHAGYERPSDLLNGTEAFFPAIDADGSVRILRRDAVVTATVPADCETEAAGDGSDGPPVQPSLRAEVAVILSGGATLRGVVEYLMPEGRSRLQDFLNQEERFLALRRDGMVHLINKQHIARVDAL